MKTRQKWYLAIGIVILSVAVYLGIQTESLRVEEQKRMQEQEQQQKPQVGMWTTTLTGIPDEQTGDTADDFDGKYQANDPQYVALSARCKAYTVTGTKATVQRYGNCNEQSGLPYAGWKLVYAGISEGKEIFAKGEATGTPYVFVFSASDVLRAVASLQTLQPEVILPWYCELIAAETTKKSVRWELTPTAKFQAEITDVENRKTKPAKLSNGASPMYPCGMYRSITQVAGTTTYVYVRNVKDATEQPGFYVDIQGVKIVK